MSTQAYREIRQTGFFGKVVRLLFLVFNALMLIWLVSYWVTLSGQGVSTSAERTGAAIGGMIGSALLLFFWLAGAGIVGALALATRGPKLIIPIDTTSTPPSTRRKPVLLACAGFFVAFCVVAATLRSEKLPLTTEPPTAHTKTNPAPSTKRPTDELQGQSGPISELGNWHVLHPSKRYPWV
jgi:hypothetical protein